jgi:hypothetical protein
MAVSERSVRLLLGLLWAAIVGASALVDFPARSGRQFWGDGATYYAMTWSLAEDGDLVFDGRDLARVRREFPSGPQGIFLKRAKEGRIYFAKAFVHPVAAAPFVKAFGTRGLMVANGLAFAAALVALYVIGRARALSAPASLLLAAVLLGAGVAPVYVVWPAPEILNVALIAGGLACWVRGHPFVGAVLLGIATYSKPYNLFTALPLGVEPFLPGLARAVPGRDRVLLRGLGQSALRGVFLLGTVAALFGLNAAITGEANYQGGERKTFYGEFPGDLRADGREVTFGNTGIWMTTNRPGPTVEGDEPAHRGEGPPRARSEIRESFLRNLGYFWVGRFGGALPYFMPAVLALVVFVLRGPRDAWGWMAFAGLVVSWLFYLYMIPDNWYGGGGTVGNRYFLNLLPLATFLVPTGRVAWIAVPSVAWAIVALGPLLAAPFTTALNPGWHALRQPFRSFPAELTMLNDLAVFTERWRKKQPVGDTEGDAHKHWPADPKAYYLYFPTNGTRGLEASGFRLCGGDGEIIVRALEPVRRLTVRVSEASSARKVMVRLGGVSRELSLGPGQKQEAVFEPGPGFQWYDTFLHVLQFTSDADPLAAPAPPSPCGPLVEIGLQTDRRAR